MAMLNSLVIKNFRMLEDFTVEKLGRVNLIVGKSHSGKSTVLEALRIYAANADYKLLESIAASHDEEVRTEKFEYKQGDEIRIGEHFFYEDLYSYGKFSSDGNLPQMVIGEEGANPSKLFVVRQPFYFRKVEARVFNIGFVPSQLEITDELAREWDNIVYTEHEKILNDLLKIVVSEFEHLVFVQNKRSTSSRIGKLKLSNLARPVPLKSLGDGMLRVLQIAIQLISAQGGFLLIDEFENGLHYSVQEEVWKMLFKMAKPENLNVQIFATTHSWDCVQSFNNVAIEKENIEAMLIHMGKSARKSNYGQIIASVYDKNELHSMAQADIEVR